MPEIEGDPAREGTCAAWVAETVINGDASVCDDLVGKTHENGWLVEQEMADLVQPYVEMVMSRDTFEAELKRSASMGDTTLTGTLDAESMTPDVLYIDDLKYGYDVVEPVNNAQLKCYLWLRARSSRAQITWPQTVKLSIYQPRALHRDGIYRTWTLTMQECQEIVAEIDTAVANFALRRNATPGSHCMHCLSANTCEALTHTTYSMWDVVSGSVQNAPDGPSIAQELDFLTRADQLLKARKAAVSADIEARLAANKFVPGWAMEERFGKRMFRLDRASIEALTGVDPVEEKMITPAALERAGVSKKTVKAMTRTPMIGRKLSRVDETQIARIFTNG